MKMNIRSTDFSSLHMNSLVLNKPNIKILSNPDSVAMATHKSGPVTMPVDLELANFSVNDASLEYIAEKPGDTLTINTLINIKAKNLHTNKNQPTIVEFDKV